VLVVFGLARVLGVAVGLLLALARRAALALAAADDAAVALADAGAESAEDFGVLVAPFPDAGGVKR
jgi:hypothetical protein